MKIIIDTDKFNSNELKTYIKLLDDRQDLEKKIEQIENGADMDIITDQITIQIEKGYHNNTYYFQKEDRELLLKVLKGCLAENKKSLENIASALNLKELKEW